MPLYEDGEVRINYEDTGSGFPLLIIPGGGLNSRIGLPAPFDAMKEFSGEYRCIVADLRNAVGGGSSGPIDVDRPWDSYADDQLGLMDHLGIERFMVMGFCIGAPFCWNLVRRAGDQVVAGVLAQPSGYRAASPSEDGQGLSVHYGFCVKEWLPGVLAQQPQVREEVLLEFLRRMYAPDFVFTVTREFVQNCDTPILVLPDETITHPYDVAMESARLARNSQVSLYPWQESPDLVALALRHVRMFLAANLPG